MRRRCVHLLALGLLVPLSLAHATDREACYSRCDALYSECQADQGVTDKTVCHNNRNTCTISCNQAPVDKRPPSGTSVPLG